MTHAQDFPSAGAYDLPDRRPVTALLRWLLRALDQRSDRRRLNALSDHMLRDMGFSRDQIDDVVRGSLRRPGY